MGDIPQRVSDTGVLTTVNLAIVAVLIVLTILGMIWGARLKRQRAEADRIEAERVEAEGGRLPSPGEARRPLDEAAAAPQTAATTDPAKRSPPVARAEVPASAAPAPVDAPESTATSEPSDASPAALPAEAPEPAVAPTAPDEPAAPDVTHEPVAAAAPLDAAPASGAEPAAPPSTTAGEGDAPVTRIKGVGPKVAALLAERGIATVSDLAALDARAAQDLDAHLGAFTGRMTRDRWLEQAQLLAAGDVATYEERFGKL